MISGGFDQPAARRQDQLLPIFWRQRWIIIGCTLAGIGLGIAYLFLARPVYTSTARMKIVPAVGRTVGEQSLSDSVNANYLQTESDLIMSPAVLVLALQMPEVKPFLPADMDPIQYLQKSMGVEPGKREAAITVSFSSTDRNAAAVIANAIVKAYQNYEVTPKQSTLGDVEQLTLDVKRLDDEIKTIGNDMSALEKEHGALDPVNQQNTLAQRQLEDLSKRLLDAQLKESNERVTNQAAASIIERLRKQGVPTDTADFDILALTPEQREKLPADITMVRQMLHDTPYLANHPKRKALEDQLNVLELTYAKVTQQGYTRLLNEIKTLQDEVAKAQEKANKVSVASKDYARLQKEWDNHQKRRDSLETRLSEIQYARQLGVYQIDVFEWGRPEFKPSSPSKKTTLPVSTLLGLMIGCGLGFLRDWRDDRFRTVDEIKNALGLPLLGTVPQLPEGLPPALAGQQAMLEPTSALAEACRTIRTAIYFGAKERCGTIHVTSPVSSDGKSTLAANLAITMAQAGKRVLLIDADLRLPTQHTIFGIRHEQGLSTVLNGTATLDQAVQPTAISGLEILPCGPKPSHPTEMLNSAMFGELLEVLSERYDTLIIDSPPVMGIADARIIAASCEISILVLKAETSTRRTSDMARDGLESVGANLLGIIINQVQPSNGHEYGYYAYQRRPQQRSRRASLIAKN